LVGPATPQMPLEREQAVSLLNVVEARSQNGLLEKKRLYVRIVLG